MRARSSNPIFFCLVVLATVLLFSDFAGAEAVKKEVVAGDDARSLGDLGSQVERLLGSWNNQGVTLRQRPRFLRRGESVPAFVSASAELMKDDACLTLVVIGSSNSSFHLQARGDIRGEDRWPIPSAAGLVEVTRCGSKRKVMNSFDVSMRSRRGVIEILSLHSTTPPVSAREVLRGRDPGPVASSPQMGPRPHLASISERLQRKLQLRQQRGASSTQVSGTGSDEYGRGRMIMNLLPGCHMIDVLAPPHVSAPPDIDARLIDLVQGETLALDDAKAGAATLVHCVSRTERVGLQFQGAQANAELSILHASWDIPPQILLEWGERTRASLAEALLKAGGLKLTQESIWSIMGVRGEASVLLELLPSRCYQLAVAPFRGEPQRMSLLVETELAERKNQSTQSGDGTALEFCTGETGRTRIHVDAAGSSCAWIAALWPSAFNDAGQDQ